MKSLALLLLLPVVLAPRLSGESFIQISKDTYVLAHNESNKDGSLLEFLIPPETLENWSSLVGVRKILKQKSPKEYIESMASEYRKGYPHMQFAVFEKKETNEWVIDFIIYPLGEPQEGHVEWNYFQAGKNPSGKGIVVNQFVIRRPFKGDQADAFKALNLGVYRPSMLPVLMKSRFTIEERLSPSTKN